MRDGGWLKVTNQTAVYRSVIESVEGNGKCVSEFHKSPVLGIYQCGPGICCDEPLHSSHKINQCLIKTCLAFLRYRN